MGPIDPCRLGGVGAPNAGTEAHTSARHSPNCWTNSRERGPVDSHLRVARSR
jgi:hypothetical protein